MINKLVRPTCRLFMADPADLMKKSKLAAADSSDLPIFDRSKLFFLETLGEGGFGIVQKAYDKEKNEFIAIKTFKKVLKALEREQQSNELLKEIIMEDALLQSIEKIRTIEDSQNHQYFLKYDGFSKMMRII